MTNAQQNFISPIGELEWVVISGEGVEGMNAGDPYKYVANIVLDKQGSKNVKDKIDSFWKLNRPKVVKTPKATGLYQHKVKTEEIDNDTGKPVYAATGSQYLRMSTRITWPNGNTKKVKVFNAKGAEITLGDTKIGNGSLGRLIGVIDIYAIKDSRGNISSAGVTFYLQSIQISKLLEYDAGVLPDEIDGDFEGTGEVGGIPMPMPGAKAKAKAKAKAMDRIDDQEDNDLVGDDIPF